MGTFKQPWNLIIQTKRENKEASTIIFINVHLYPEKVRDIICMFSKKHSIHKQGKQRAEQKSSSKEITRRVSLPNMRK